MRGGAWNIRAARPYNEDMGALSLVTNEPAMRKPEESGLRFALGGQRAIGTLAERQCELNDAIAAATEQVQRRTHDPSAHAALQTVAARLSDIADVREVLDDVIAALWLTQVPPDARAALVKYLEGVQRWALVASEELSALAVALIEMRADWSSFRRRLALAKAEWPTELLGDVGRDLARLDDVDVASALEELGFALHVLDANLEQRFG